MPVNRSIIVLALLAMGVLSACTEPSEQLFRQAAPQRWQALLQSDFKRAYEYYGRDYQKIMPLENFEKSIKGIGLWKNAEVVDAHCQGDRCLVDINITVAMKMSGVPDPVESSGVVQEVWMKDAGWLSEWRYVKK